MARSRKSRKSSYRKKRSSSNSPARRRTYRKRGTRKRTTKRRGTRKRTTRRRTYRKRGTRKRTTRRGTKRGTRKGSRKCSARNKYRHCSPAQLRTFMDKSDLHRGRYTSDEMRRRLKYAHGTDKCTHTGVADVHTSCNKDELRSIWNDMKRNGVKLHGDLEHMSKAQIVREINHARRNIRHNTGMTNTFFRKGRSDAFEKGIKLDADYDELGLEDIFSSPENAMMASDVEEGLPLPGDNYFDLV